VLARRCDLRGSEHSLVRWAGGRPVLASRHHLGGSARVCK